MRRAGRQARDSWRCHRCGACQAGEAKSFKLVANLPYNIASPLLVNLVTQGLGGLALSGAVVMVQREAADRLCASPGGKDYGPLGVMVGAMCRVQRVAVVGPGCFWPRPKVEVGDRAVDTTRPAIDR